MLHSVLETPILSRRADALLSHEDRTALITALARDPLAGDLVPGPGGVDELIASMQDAAAILDGETEPARVHLPLGSIDVRAIREKLGLSRPAFAQRFGLAVTALRDWEQGVRRPGSAACILLAVIARTPDAVAEAVAEAHAAWQQPG